ncbi:MAG: glycosyltransferase family 39 protein [Paracoccaceae bacterium]|uniref:glycosyltransferase family 39 protein n=1 Tax=Shimia thalassica TaxID=1715693 RepID=UPI0032982446
MSSAKPISASDRAVLAAALVLGAGVLWFRLGWQSFWWDEHVTLMFTRLDWAALMVEHWGLDTHRPVYYGLQKLWIGLVGDNVAAVRSLQVVLILPVIAIFFAIGRRIGGPQMGWIAALLIGSAPMFLYQGRELRMYALVSLLLALALWIAVVLANRARAGEAHKSTIPLWIAFTVLMAAAFYTQALAAFVALLFGLWILICCAFGILPLRFLGQALLAGVLYLVLLIPALQPFFAHATGTIGSNFWLPEPSLSYVYAQMATAYAYPKLMKPVIGLMLIWGFWSLRDRPHVFWLCVLMVIGLPALVIGISFWKPIFMAKVVAWGSLVSIFVLAAGLMALPRIARWGGVLVILVSQLMAAWSFYPAAPEQDPLAEIAAGLEGFDPSQDILVLGNQMQEPALRWYAPDVFAAGRIYGFTYGDWTQNVIDAALASTHVMRADAAPFAATDYSEEARLWVFSETTRNPRGAPEDDTDGALQTLIQGRQASTSLRAGRFALHVYPLN